MGLFDFIFKSSDEDSSTKVRVSRENNARISASKYEFTDKSSGKHVDRGYNLDKTTGAYKEYSGGENSPDRSYNKK
jgi:hypothetical protein